MDLRNAGYERGSKSFIPVDALFRTAAHRLSSHVAETTTSVRSNIPSDIAVAEVGELENDVQFLDLGEGYYCLNHSLRHAQVFGNAQLRDSIRRFERGQQLPLDLRTALQAEGFIAEPGQDKNARRAQLAQREDDRVTSNADFTLLRILLTDYCNLKCDYCKVVKNVAKPQKAPTGIDRLSEVLEYYFANSAATRPKIIHCTGGEPMLHWPELKHLLAEKRRLSRPGENCWIVIGTNATLVDQARAETLGDHGAKCIVSMDGPADVHDPLRPNHANRGSWSQVDRGIKLLQRNDVEVSISIVFGKHNLSRADEIIAWIMDEYKPTGLGVNFMKPPTPQQRDYPHLIEGEDYAETLYKIHQRWRESGLFLELVHRKLDPFVNRTYRFHDCGAAGGANLNLDAKGKVGPCKSFLVMDRLAITDLNSTRYTDQVLTKWRARSPIYYDYCDGCAARGMCGNGCAYDAFVNHENEMAIDERSCSYTKRFNQLMVADLFELSGGPRRADRSGWYVVSESERRLVMGAVAARPNSLSYSIGHHSAD